MVNQEVEKFAQALGLDLVPTRSGDSYDHLIFLDGQNGPEIFIESPDAGNGIKDLDERAGVICIPAPGTGAGCCEALFKTAREALTALTNQDFVSALVWTSAQVLETGPALRQAMAHVVWSDETAEKIRKQDLTFREVAEAILAESCEEVVNI